MIKTGPDQQSFGVGDKGAEIRHGPQAQKNHAGDDFPFHAVMIKGADQFRGAVFGHAHERGQGEIDQENSEPDGQQQQRFKLFADGQIHENQTDAQHHSLAAGQMRNACLGHEDVLDQFQNVFPRHCPFLLYKGIFPCFLGGLVACLVLSMRRASIIFNRVSAGSMTSSM